MDGEEMDDEDDRTEHTVDVHGPENRWGRGVRFQPFQSEGRGMPEMAGRPAESVGGFCVVWELCSTECGGDGGIGLGFETNQLLLLVGGKFYANLEPIYSLPNETIIIINLNNKFHLFNFDRMIVNSNPSPTPCTQIRPF